MANLSQKMQTRLQNAISNPVIREKGEKDLKLSLIQLGMEEENAKNAVKFLLDSLNKKESLEKIESDLWEWVQTLRFPNKSDENHSTIFEAFRKKFENRANTICEQITPHLGNNSKQIIDWGMGTGEVSREVQKKTGATIVGCDVEDYRISKIGDFFKVGEDCAIPSSDESFDAGIVTNVLHHEENYHLILSELKRILKKGARLVIIETVPVGNTDEEVRVDADRTFLSDYVCNRIFQNPKWNIPVPGAYRTAQGWEEYLVSLGWKFVYSEALGIDLPIVQDFHHLIVVEKK